MLSGSICLYQIVMWPKIVLLLAKSLMIQIESFGQIYTESKWISLSMKYLKIQLWLGFVRYFGNIKWSFCHWNIKMAIFNSRIRFTRKLLSPLKQLFWPFSLETKHSRGSWRCCSRTRGGQTWCQCQWRGSCRPSTIRWWTGSRGSPPCRPSKRWRLGQQPWRRPSRCSFHFQAGK